jgi:hypothetical protein
MIQAIDIFAPRENGLPDFSKISPGQIFNGSLAASVNSAKQTDPLGLLDQKQDPGGERESPWKTTTIDARTGRRVEVRKARVVEEVLNGKSPAARGHRKINESYSTPDYGVPESPLPDDANPLPPHETPANPSLLEQPAPTWHPPMAPDYQPGIDQFGIPSLFPPNLTPDELKSSALRGLPTILLDELKSLHLV